MAFLAGMALVAVGTFLAQALATGFVSRTATVDRTAASGLYLTICFPGGLAGAIVPGQVHADFGWQAMSAWVAGVLIFSAMLAHDFDVPNA